VKALSELGGPWEQPGKVLDKINLIARNGSAQDLAVCYALHELCPLPYPETSRRALLGILRALLVSGAMKLFLVEDRAKPVCSRVVSFNAIVFVTDKFCSEARSTLPPYVSVQLTRQYLSRQSPVLNREQIARANADSGLNVLMCFEGWTQDGISPEQILAVREKQTEASQLGLRGYRIKEFLAAPIGPFALQWMLDAGARLRCDYSYYFQTNHLHVLKPSQRRPYLVGLTKEEAFAHPGSYLASLFVYTEPRFHFSRSQRTLLDHALMGETCGALATSLSLSPWTVKKRWRAIYDRVADVDKDLLPPSIAYGAHASSRGAERRRHLLNYLRQHVEELRPFQLQQKRWGKRALRNLSSALTVFVLGIAFFGTSLFPVPIQSHRLPSNKESL
jgi:DNA-binding CsgD family transcriptional regulator